MKFYKFLYVLMVFLLIERLLVFDIIFMPVFILGFWFLQKTTSDEETLDSNRLRFFIIINGAILNIPNVIVATAENAILNSGNVDPSSVILSNNTLVMRMLLGYFIFGLAIDRLKVKFGRFNDFKFGKFLSIRNILLVVLFIGILIYRILNIPLEYLGLDSPESIQRSKELNHAIEAYKKPELRHTLLGKSTNKYGISDEILKHYEGLVAKGEIDQEGLEFLVSLNQIERNSFIKNDKDSQLKEFWSSYADSICRDFVVDEYEGELLKIPDADFTKIDFTKELEKRNNGFCSSFSKNLTKNAIKYCDPSLKISEFCKE